MRVMVAEDDAALSLFLKKALQLEGHTVHTIADGMSALDRIYEDMPDMLVLDLGLPHMDGVDVLRALNNRAPAMSILVLSGRSDSASKVECLNLGADDYLMKPFSMFELLARCRAIARRMLGTGAAVLQYASLRMDRIHRSVTFRDQVLDLTAKEYTLLEYLLEHKGTAVSRRELLGNVWHMSPEAGTNVVDVYVNYLRRKFLAVGAVGLIDTVRGEGYSIGAKDFHAAERFRKSPQPHTAGGYSGSREVA